MPDGKITRWNNDGRTYIGNSNNQLIGIANYSDLNNYLSTSKLHIVQNKYTFQDTIFTNGDNDTKTLQYGTLTYDAHCLYMMVYYNISMSGNVTISRGNISLQCTFSGIGDTATYRSLDIYSETISSSQNITSSLQGVLYYQQTNVTDTLRQMNINGEQNINGITPLQHNVNLCSIYQSQSGYSVAGNSANLTYNISVTIQYISIPEFN